jgi:hypothetical protein
MQNLVDPIFSLFCFLSESRRSKSIRNLRERLHQRQVVLTNRIDFYIHLCQASQLLTSCASPKPTNLCFRFFSWPKHAQYEHLLEGWVNMIQSKYPKIRRDKLRTIILNNQMDQLLELANLPSFNREIQSLRFLKIVTLNPLQIQEQSKILTDHMVDNSGQPWQYQSDTMRIVVTLPTRLSLLWELEKYLLPVMSKGRSLIYSLKNNDFWGSYTKQEKEHIENILQCGLQMDLPEELTNFLNQHPHIQCEPGYLLTFCQRETLAEMHRDSSTRKILADLISPNHVFLPLHDADEKFRALEQKKILPYPDENLWPGSHKAEQAAADQNLLSNLLTLSWYAQKQQLHIGLSKSNLQKLINSLPPKVANLALQIAETTNDAPISNLLPEPFESASGIQEEKIESINHAIMFANSITIMYQGAGQSSATVRKVTPLMLEKRGGYFYLIAFCEQRCARRTFRLDRLQIIKDEEI